MSATAGTDAGDTVTPPDGAQVADVAVDIAADSVTLTPGADPLQGKDTVYAVCIDPVHDTANRTSWAMVSSYHSGSSSSFWKFDDDEGAGRCPERPAALKDAITSQSPTNPAVIAACHGRPDDDAGRCVRVRERRRTLRCAGPEVEGRHQGPRPR
ncbi:hypothetical protein [Streptomyces sp. NPDC051684]|uniref:hypothetical protein n=1 Tax=Streptomyces sp. NPDC051684 TaxID=3365670 RepID=UPI00378CA85E